MKAVGDMLFLLIILSSLLTACGSGDDPSLDDRWAAVDARVRREIRTLGPAHLLLIGDSLTAQNPVTTLCGLPVVNAGYPGATWHDVLSRPVFASLHSEIAVVMLGTNNAGYGVPITADGMLQLLGHLHADRLVVETPPYRFDAIDAAHHLILVHIQDAVVTLPFQTIDSRSVMGNPALYHDDGIHWNAAGYQTQNHLLKEAVCPL